MTPANHSFIFPGPHAVGIFHEPLHPSALCCLSREADPCGLSQQVPCFLVLAQVWATGGPGRRIRLAIYPLISSLPGCWGLSVSLFRSPCCCNMLVPPFSSLSFRFLQGCDSLLLLLTVESFPTPCWFPSMQSRLCKCPLLNPPYIT